MAEAIAFDTHRFVKRLTESGFTEKQAETHAEEHVAFLNANLATKAEITAIKADIDALRDGAGHGGACRRATNNVSAPSVRSRREGGHRSVCTE